MRAEFRLRALLPCYSHFLTDSYASDLASDSDDSDDSDDENEKLMANILKKEASDIQLELEDTLTDKTNTLSELEQVCARRIVL